MQVQDERQLTATEYLRQAIRNVNDSKDIGEDAKAHLAVQREMLNNISQNVGIMHSNLDVADRKLSEMERPFFFLPTRTKKSGERSGALDGVAEGGQAAYVTREGKFQMSGYVLKRSDWLKSWNRRFFKLDGGHLLYFKDAADPRPRGSFDLLKVADRGAGCGVREVPRRECGRENAFEIRMVNGSRVLACCEDKADCITWIHQIERAVRDLRPDTGRTARPAAGYHAAGYGLDAPGSIERGMGAGSAAGAGSIAGDPAGAGGDPNDALLDQLMDGLTDLNGMGRDLQQEIRHQTGMIDNVNEEVENVHGRIRKNQRRVRRL
jgi:hypothetical protein